MYKDEMMKKYRAKLVREGIVSSLAFGLMFGAAADFLAALVAWIFAFSGVWLPLCVGGAVFAVSAVLLYLLKFRPTERTVALRMDRMGLEERTVTMLELSGEDSYIAKRQREDAREKAAAVTPAQVKANFPLYALRRGATVLLAVAVFCGAGMTTVMALTGAGVIPSPDILPSDDAADRYFNVSYLVEGGGDIEGEPEQPVLAGGDASPVVAVAEDGWVFVKWSDGIEDPARTDLNVTEDLTVTAIFEEIGEGGDGSGDDDSTSSDEGDHDKDAPDGNDQDSSSIGGSNGDGGEGDGSGNKGDGSGTGDGGQQGDGKGNGRGDGAGGGASDSSSFKDGKTDYRDVYDIYYDQAMEILRNGGELPDYLKEFIEKYYGSI